MSELVPDDRNYTRHHIWVKLDEARVSLGVTKPLLDSLGTLLSLELPAPEVEMMQDVAFGEIESMEQTFQLFPPAEAEVLETNYAVSWDLDRLAEDPYGEGWLIKIKVHDSDQLKELLTPDAYREYCEENLEQELEDEE